MLALYLLGSAAWSWPTARLDAGVLVTRHFDLYPAAWLATVVRDLGPDLVSRASAWPFGEPLVRMDSGLYAGVAWGLAGLDPARLLALWTWMGPALSAMAAERCAAVGFAVPRPWSLLAGALYGFGGVAAQALLEGHVYHLLAPWLPLLWLAWTWPAPRRAGLGVGAALALGWFSTAYAGVLGAVLLATLALSDLRRARRVVPWALLVAGPALGAWAALYAAGGGFAEPDPDLVARVGRMGTPTLAGLATWSPGADLAHHSMAAPLGWVGLFLLVLAPRVLRGEPGWRAPLGLAVAAVGLALGRSVRLDEGVDLFDWGVDALAALPGAAAFRFPIRLLWLWSLVAGVVGARVLATLAGRASVAPAFGVLGLGLAEAWLAPMLPLRLHRVPVTVPAAYAAAPAGRAVLDVWGRSQADADEWEMWSRNLGCFYAARHRRPVLEVCLGTAVRSPRERVEAWLWPRLGEPATWETLARLGVGAVAFHVATWSGSDRAWVWETLTPLLGAPVESTEAGRVLLFPLPERPMAVEAAWAELNRGT